jgi:hypothetical protein
MYLPSEGDFAEYRYRYRNDSEEGSDSGANSDLSSE